MHTQTVDTMQALFLPPQLVRGWPIISCLHGSLKFNCLSIRYQDEYGDTPLIAACGNGHSNVASLLITKGALVNFQTKVWYS